VIPRHRHRAKADHSIEDLLPAQETHDPVLHC
jgi:hypothetical protein